MTTPRLTPIALALRRAALASLLAPAAASGGPSGAEIVHGQVNLTSPDPGALVIDQQSDAAIINWQSFSIGADEYVVFNQPSASAAVLNRVIGQLPSEILGDLTANGRVFLINPQGILFGAGARVDVGALMTSTQDISDRDFAEGRYVFAGDSTAGIRNEGEIRSGDGGFVVLSADHIHNSGTIEAPAGDVVLAAGSRLTLHTDAEGLVSYTVDAAAASDAAGIENLGEIVARGGAVVMHAQVARDLLGTVVNNRGVVRADAVEERGGEIWLVANGGNLEQHGTLDASSAASDGGTIGLRSDASIEIASGSLAAARGGNGGEVTAVAGDRLVYAQGAGISVAGDGPGGLGGFAELSGHDVLIQDTVDLGRGGALLIDPYDFVVSEDYGGGNLTYSTLEAMLQNAFGSTITIQGENSVTFEDIADNELNGFGAGPDYGGSLQVIAGCNPDCVEPVPGEPNAPGIHILGADDVFNIDGDIRLDNRTSGDVDVAATLNAGDSGTVSVLSGGDIRVGDVSATQIELIAHDGVTAGHLQASDTAEFDGDALYASVYVMANNVPVDESAPDPGASRDITIDRISVSTEAGSFNGVSANSQARIDSTPTGGPYSADGRRSGGAVTIVNGVTVEANALPAVGLLEAGASPGGKLSGTEDAIATLQIQADGDVDAADVRVVASGLETYSELDVGTFAGGDIRLPSITMGTNAAVTLMSTALTDTGTGQPLPGSADVEIGLQTTTLDFLRVDAGGTLSFVDGRLPLSSAPSLTAQTLQIYSGAGDLVLSDLTSLDGSIEVVAFGGRIIGGNFSATLTGDSSPYGGCYYYCNQGVLLYARDGVQTTSVNLLLQADAPDQFLTAGLDVNGSAFASGSPIGAGGAVDLGDVDIVFADNGFSPAYVELYAYLQNLAAYAYDAETGSDSYSGGGDILLSGYSTPMLGTLDIAAQGQVVLPAATLAADYLSVSSEVGDLSFSTLAATQQLDLYAGGGGISIANLLPDLMGPLGIYAAMSLDIPLQALMAGSIKIYSGLGDLTLLDVTASNGAVLLEARGGALNVENVSATWTSDYGEYESADKGSEYCNFYSSACIELYARDGISAGALTSTAIDTVGIGYLNAGVAAIANALSLIHI